MGAHTEVDAKGNIFLEGQKGNDFGVFCFHPDSIQVITDFPPLVLLDFLSNSKEKPDLTSVGNRLYAGGPLELSHDQDIFSIHFTALAYHSPEKIQFAYRLDGFDEDWRRVGSSREATFTNLDPGDYTFRLISTNRQGIWGQDGPSLQITILPPWWATWWARICYLLIFMMAIGGYIRLRTQNLNNQKEVLEQTVKERTVELKLQKERAERSERFKEQFLANMSHEIRTPMHAISGMVKILRRNKHYSAQEVFLDAMHQSADNLLVLLNDILDLSKIEAGKLDIESIPMEPAAVIQIVFQILQFKAEEKGLELHTSISDDLPTFIMGDPTRLGQILTNLAGNAIKFTEKGSVSISANKKNDFIIFEIRDTGIGIQESKLQRIFEAFEQAEGSTTRKFGGTGLGLNISRQLVEMQGGNIWAESESGKGSSFFVSLPLITVGETAVTKQHVSEEQLMAMAAALKGTRFLLAEDNEFNQMIAEDDLAFYIPDVQVDIVGNGALAFEKAQTGAYDIILMDVQMPEMDGLEAAQKIRKWEKENDKSPIPIIAMTASVLKSEVNLCLEAGMDNYIPKPYQAEELIGRIYEEIQGKHSKG